MACVRAGSGSAPPSSSNRPFPYMRPAATSNLSSQSSRKPKSLKIDLSRALSTPPDFDAFPSTSSRHLNPQSHPSSPARCAASYSSSTYSSSSFPRPPNPFSNSSPLPELSQTYTALTPHLAVADLAFAEDAAQLRCAGITHVVSVVDGRIHIPSYIPPSRRLHVPLGDTPFAELVGTLGPVASWVASVLREAGVLPGPHSHRLPPTPYDPQPVRILIHCAQGISRSPAVAAALLIALPLVRSSPLSPAHTLPASAALAYVAAHRPAADINWGFRAQLAEWEAVCRAGRS